MENAWRALLHNSGFLRFLSFSTKLRKKHKNNKNTTHDDHGLRPHVLSSAFVAESTLSHNVEAHHGLVPKLGHHGGKNHRLFKPKNMISLQAGNQGILYSRGRTYLVFEPEGRWFLPLMMFSVAKQRVMMAGRVRECALRHKALTAARKLEELKHQQRSFEGFC